MISRIRDAGRFSTLALASLLFLGCPEDDSSEPVTIPWACCSELSDSLFPKPQRTGIATFKVVAPDSGSFQVG